MNINKKLANKQMFTKINRATRINNNKVLLFVIYNFLNSEECDRLIKIANQNEKFSSQIKKIKEFHNNLLEHNKFISLREELSREIEFDKDYDVSKLKRHKKNIENSILKQ